MQTRSGYDGGEVNIQAPQSELPASFAHWIEEASDLQIARAIVEEFSEYLPAALDGLRAEAARRELDCRAYLSQHAAPQRKLRRADRLRYLFGGIALAALGFVPAFLPKEYGLECVILLDNPGNEDLRVQVQSEEITVRAGGARSLTLNVIVQERPAWRWWAGVTSNSEVATTLPLVVVVASARGTVRERRLARVRQQGRVLMSLVSGVSYVVEGQKYVRNGPHGIPEGTVVRHRVLLGKEPLDLDLVRIPDFGRVKVFGLSEGFPSRLELPEFDDGNQQMLWRLTRPQH